ncbi:hypothetical protein FA95DRAFT_938157 [Auriscalpium vulgare]|uniref:Uncharacterized protein n=1 Tax=Auriscalpium vulgare TaxID=40419 RepID=A0ACB8SAF9_9AGAM|nr:hypothetical protein FA95DRAFT_938157 [Auriscalpium vulgare]
MCHCRCCWRTSVAARSDHAGACTIPPRQHTARWTPLSGVADEEEHNDGATEAGAESDTETEEFHDTRASIALTTSTYSHTLHSARPFSADEQIGFPSAATRRAAVCALPTRLMTQVEHLQHLVQVWAGGQARMRAAARGLRTRRPACTGVRVS